MKYTYQDVKKFIEVESKSECKLLDNTYENCKQLLNIQCKCNNQFQVTFDTFKHKKKRQCNECTVEEKRKDVSEIEKVINDNGYVLIETEYREMSGNRKILYVHILCQEKHKSYWTSWQKFKKGQRCSKCYHQNKLNKPDKWNEKNIRKLLKENSLIIADHSYEFNNAKNKIKCINQDGFFVDVLINSLKRGITPSPFKRNKYALENLMILCEKNDLILSPNQEWKGAKHKYNAAYLNGYKVQFYSDLLLNGDYPKVFHTSNPFTLWNLQHYCNINNLEYQVISDKYINHKEPLKFKYIGNEINMEESQRYFTISLNKFINLEQRHPLFNQSKGENQIEQWLIKNDFKFIPQYKFDDCKSINSLRFDFAVFNKQNNLICLIEYDGIQHFEPVKHFGGIDNFEITKKRDEIKNTYCKKNNINLLRISYWNKSNIEFILNNHIS